MKQEISPLSNAQKPKVFYGYVIVLVSLGIQAVAWGTFSTYGVFFTSLQTEFGWSRAMISGASSLRSLVLGLVGVFVGGLSDKLGPRKVMAACGLIFGLGHLLMAQVQSPWQLYLFYGVMVGIGGSGGDVVLLSTVARWFVKKRGIMSGIVKVGTGIGQVILPVAAGLLIASYNWRIAYIVLGAVSIVLILPLAQFLKRNPAEMGQLPDGKAQTASSSPAVAEGGMSFREAARTPQFWMICGSYFTMVACSQTVLIHIAPHVEDTGISPTSAAVVLSVIGGASIAGRLIMGYAGDRIGTKRSMLICFGTLFTSLVWLQFTTGLWMFYVFAAIYGYSHGGFFALISPMVAGFFGTRSHGANLGIVIFSGMIGGAIIPLVAGYIFDVTTPHSYRIAFILLLVLCVVGAALMALLRPIARGPKPATPR